METGRQFYHPCTASFKHDNPLFFLPQVFVVENLRCGAHHDTQDGLGHQFKELLILASTFCLSVRPISAQQMEWIGNCTECTFSLQPVAEYLLVVLKHGVVSSDRCSP